MKKPVAVLIAIVVATVALGAPVKKKLTLEEQAFATACFVSKYSCRGLKPPAIIFAPLEDLRGRYIMGDTFVLIDERMENTITFAVIVHEYTHFLQFKAGVWTGTAANVCKNEKEAFMVANVALQALGEALVDWEGSMRLAYGCPAAPLP